MKLNPGFSGGEMAVIVKKGSQQEIY